MSTIPAIAQAMLGTDAVAHVWTNNADGSPQVSVVWVIAQGDEILFGTDANSEKAKNLRRDGRVILSIEDVERNERGYQRHLVIRGRANALVRADLDYTLEQVEQRFEKRLRAEGHHFIHLVQPILESCLLIQSPAPPR